MPHRSRCLLPGVPCHLTQRGVGRCAVFSSDLDRFTSLRLLRENLQDAQVRVIGWCLMSYHIHLIAVREREDLPSVLPYRVLGQYVQYFNTHAAPSATWQN
ncbi:MAG: transposase [Acidobacteria bacterium]|nr:transposase [Acidobacteriota bacterium]